MKASGTRSVCEELKRKKIVPFLMDIAKRCIQLDFGPHFRGDGQKMGGCLSAQAGEHQPHCAQSHAHLLIRTEMLSTRELWKGLASTIGSQRMHASFSYRAPCPSPPSDLCSSTILLHRRIVALTLETDSDSAILQKRFVEEMARKKEKSASSSI